MIRDARIFVSTLLDQYRGDRQLARRSVEEYRRAVVYFSDWLGRPAEIHDLTRRMLIDFRTSRIDQGSRKKSNKPLSRATANKDIRPLVVLWRYAFNEEIIDEAPRKIDKLPEPKRRPEAYSVEEITRILQSAREETQPIDGVAAGLWWTSAIAAMYDTGYRRRALLLSRWSDFDAENRVLRRPAEDQKQRADQAQELHPDTVRLIQSIRAPARELIWPWPFYDHGPWYRRLRRILARAGLTSLPRKPAHALRASHATYLADVAGLEAAAASCGHSSPSVTRGHYIDPTKLSTSKTASRIARPRMPSLEGQRRLFE